MRLNISYEIDNILSSDIIVVYNQIEEKYPQDAARLCNRINKILPLPKVESEKGICGQWEKGILRIGTHESLEITRDALRGVIAHEFGHAVSKESEVHDRMIFGYFEEWAREATADWHACKWGFKKNIELLLDDRKLMHHGIFPGMKVTIGEGDDAYTLTVDDEFYPVLLNTPTLSADDSNNISQEGFEGWE